MKKITMFLTLCLTACPGEKVGKAYYCPKICQKGYVCNFITKDSVESCSSTCLETEVPPNYTNEQVKQLTDEIFALSCEEFKYLLLRK